jgi:hypothetical protein
VKDDELRGTAPSGRLCPVCVHVQVVRSARGSLFWRCTLAARDPRFPKYPPQPVVRCLGHEPIPRTKP